MKNYNSLNKDEYIFIRLGVELKIKLKERAEQDGSNMTIWIRQMVMKELNKVPTNLEEKLNDKN